MIGTFPRHGVDAPIEILVAFLLSALEGEVLLNGKQLVILVRDGHPGHICILLC
jgi:hypothetical protein